MATKHVKSDSLNLRSEPRVADDNIVVALVKGQAVDTFSPVDANGWINVSASVNGNLHGGFVKAHLLRDAASSAQERLMSAAVAEWIRFEKGRGREEVAPFHEFVGEMWDSIGIDLDGRDTTVPWSAAFISFIVRRSGAEYAGFKFSDSHAKYIHDSIKKREANSPAPFWGFRLNEHKVALGDLVCQWRITKRTYEDARISDEFRSHCDVVVEVGSSSIRTIGGNVGNQSVDFKTYAITPDGFLKAQSNVFVVLRNNV